MVMAEQWREDPHKVRVLVAVGGLVVLGALAGFMVLRRADPVEVWATLLFLPIFLAVVLWRTVGGIVAGVLAAGTYVVLRMPAIEAAGIEPYVGLLSGRTVAYLAFGGVGGWAMTRLQRSLTKLDLYDQIDDETGLYNARFLVQGLELEQARTSRYQTVFSVAVVEVPAAAFEALSARRRARALRVVGDQIIAAIRTVDRAAHLRTGGRHLFALILPETPREGAAIFTERFRGQLFDLLRDQGATLATDDLAARSLSVPGDEDALTALREQAAALVPDTPGVDA